MAFNADAFRDAHRPWHLTVGGRSFGARHVSAPQCQRYDRMVADAGADRRKLLRALWWILRRAFPWRFSYLMRGDPVRIILAQLEPAARDAALKDFFGSLRGESAKPPQTTTPGPRSLGSTPPLRR